MPTARLPWPALLSLAAATFASVTAELAPAGLLPHISVGLHVSQPTVGLLVSAWAVTVAVATLPLVRVTRRVRRHHLMCGALLVAALATAGTALAPTYAVAAASRILAAGAHGLFWAVVIAYTASLVPERHVGRAVSVVLSGPTLAGIVGLPLTTVVGDTVGWRASFGLIAALMTVTSLLLSRVLPETRTESGAAAPSGSGWDGSGPPVVVIAFAAGLVLVGHFALFTFVSPLLTQVGNLEPTAIGPLLVVFGAAGAGGLALAAPLSDRAPRSALLLTTSTFSLGAASLVLLGRSWAIAVVLLALWGALIGLFPPVLQSTVMRTASQRFRDTAAAIVIATLNIGIAGGAAVGSRVVDSLGVQALPLTATIAMVVGTGVLAVYRGSDGWRSRQARVE